MKKQDTSSRQKKQKEIEKKLRKNERRLRDRLQAVQSAQGRAIDRLRRAEARVQKIMTHAKRIEEHLVEVRQQLAGAQNATLSGVDLLVIPPQESLQEDGVVVAIVADRIVQFPARDAQEDVADVHEPQTASSSLQPEENFQPADSATPAQEVASEARAVAEATEQETRAAAARAQEMATVETDEGQQEDTAQSVPDEHAGYPTPEEFERVEEISLAEENIEIAASMSAADAAGAAAATAEAIAEASSARANEARLVAQQAEHFLEQVRGAVRDGFIQGDEAERVLRAAENETTYAHALLADAEAAEERARNEAVNAEAEAEVAEGMARSANEHARDTVTHLDDEGAGHINGVTAASDEQDEATKQLEEDEDGDVSDTDELPAIHLREHE